MIRAESLRCARSGLHDVSATVAAGEVLAICGPNGAGKSTLLSLLSGERLPDAGDVLLDEVPMRRMEALARARRIGVLPQASSLSFPFRVAEVVALGRLPLGGAGAPVVWHSMAQAGVSHLAERLYPTLSGGEQQRVQLARVLAQTDTAGPATALLLDEPTSSLDPAQQHHVLGVARERARHGSAVAVVLHDLNLAARYADRILLLAGGSVQALGTPREVLTRAILGACFGIEAQVLPHPVHGCPLVVT
jgi:iron complex transport system ATP-binding protein